MGRSDLILRSLSVLVSARPVPFLSAPLSMETPASLGEVSVMLKNGIRNRSLCLRRQLGRQRRQLLSERAQRRLLQEPEFLAAGSIALYSPIRQEVATGLIAQAAWLSGKRVAYPEVVGETLEFGIVDTPMGLRSGHWGVLEPIGCERISTAEIDLLLVPGLAFDLRGHRLGYGKGFYDRLLASLERPRLAFGFSFECQVLNDLPVFPTDQPINALITDEQTRWFRGP